MIMGQWFTGDEVKLISWLRGAAKEDRFQVALKHIVSMKKHFNIEVTAETVDKLLPQCS